MGGCRNLGEIKTLGEKNLKILNWGGGILDMGETDLHKDAEG